jgi:hypothetical protein
LALRLSLTGISIMHHWKYPIAVLLLALLAAGAAPPAIAQPAPPPVEMAPQLPPPPRVEPVPPPPPGRAEVLFWVPGRWQWDGRAWIWLPGRYVERPRHHARWIPGHWVARPGGWMWVEGHWHY